MATTTTTTIATATSVFSNTTNNSHNRTNRNRTSMPRIAKLTASPLNLPYRLPAPKPDLSYARRPDEKRGRAVYVLWRWRMWFEGTFGLTVMEWWERWVVVTFFAILVGLLLTFLVVFLPRHLIRMQKRAVYYLYGGLDSADSDNLLKSWIPAPITAALTAIP